MIKPIVFPNQIDDRLFVSDASISTMNIYDQHQQYVQADRLTDASNYLNSQTSIVPINASLLNYMDELIHTLQTYMINDMAKATSHVCSDTEPTQDGVWIG